MPIPWQSVARLNLILTCKPVAELGRSALAMSMNDRTHKSRLPPVRLRQSEGLHDRGAGCPTVLHRWCARSSGLPSAMSICRKVTSTPSRTRSISLSVANISIVTSGYRSWNSGRQGAILRRASAAELLIRILPRNEVSSRSSSPSNARNASLHGERNPSPAAVSRSILVDLSASRVPRTRSSLANLFDSTESGTPRSRAAADRLPKRATASKARKSPTFSILLMPILSILRRRPSPIREKRNGEKGVPDKADTRS